MNKLSISIENLVLVKKFEVEIFIDLFVLRSPRVHTNVVFCFLESGCVCMCVAKVLAGWIG